MIDKENVFRRLGIHDKVEKILFVGNEWHVVLNDGVVHHYPSSSYVFELIDSLNYYGGKSLTIFFVDGSSRTFHNVHDVQITHYADMEESITVVWDDREDCRTVNIYPLHDVVKYSSNGENLYVRSKI